jgi:hypothetical protein
VVQDGGAHVGISSSYTGLFQAATSGLSLWPRQAVTIFERMDARIARTSPRAPVSRRDALRRALLAFALVPMLPAFYSAIFFAQPWALPYGLLLAYPTAWLLGVPAFLLLRHRGWLQWWQFALAGGLCSLPAVALYWRHGAPPQLEPFSVLNAFYFAGWGVFAGLCFWLLAVAGAAPVSVRTILGFEPPP